MIQTERRSAKTSRPTVTVERNNHSARSKSKSTPEKPINQDRENLDSKIQALMQGFDEERKTFNRDNFSVRSVNHSKSDFSSVADRFINDGNFRSVSISGLNAFLHALTVVTSMNKSPLIKKINHYSDKIAFFFTKIIAPYISFAFSAAKAFWDKKPIEGLIKVIPPLSLPFVGDTNVDSAFGCCFGLNQPYDLVLDRLKEKSAKSMEFAKHVEISNQSSLGNAQMVIKEFGSMLKDFVSGKLHWSSAGFLINCSMILSGSLPILLFARKDRNTTFAKTLGFLRSTGGIIGDILLLLQKANFHKFIVGILCSMGALSNIAKRSVESDALARVFIHLGAALDVAGYTVWNAWSDNKKPNNNLQPAIA